MKYLSRFSLRAPKKIIRWAIYPSNNMKLFWLLFAGAALPLLILLADSYINRYDCPQMDNSSVYSESGELICKDGKKL